MVKLKLIFILGLISTNLFAQNLSLGVGGTANTSFVGFQPKFNYNINTINNDTLVLEAEKSTIDKSISIPIFARFSSKKNWWVQLTYGFETWRLGIVGNANATEYAIERNVNTRLSNSFAQYTGSLDSASFRDEFYDVYRADEENLSKVNFEGYERVQYNKLSFAFGSRLRRRKPISLYYSFGFDLMTTSTFESYQGFVFDSDKVAFQNEILDAFPKLKSVQFAPFLNFGLEQQNLRIGVDFSYYGKAAIGGHKSSLNDVTQANGVSTQVISNISSFGVHLNYTLFNQNFNQRIGQDKKAVLDPEIIGKYIQKPKFFQFGVGLNFPTLHNSGWSVLDDYNLESVNDELNEKLRSKNDTYLTGLSIDTDNIFDFIYIEKRDADVFLNSSGEIDTNSVFTNLFFDSGNINTVLKTPKLFGFLRFNVSKNLSFDLNMGYQHQTYGIVAYETQRTSYEGEVTNTTRRLLYQENFHELNTGITAYYHVRLNNISRIGFHIGLNNNYWQPGEFIVEKGGVNDGELLEDFHDFIIENDDAEEWNRNENPDADKGLFSKEDYYNHTYEPGSDAAAEESYHSDFSAYQLDTPQKRSFAEVKIGIDYYLENLKFTLYAERSVWKKQFIYNDMLSVGMGVSLLF